MDQFSPPELNKIEEKYRKKVQSLIEYCPYCQPYDEGEVVWIFGEKIELMDLFYQCKVPERYHDKIVEYIVCPSCGFADFDFSVDVGVKTKFEKEVDSHMDKVTSLYGSDVKKFEELLESFPLLAYTNKFGKRINREIRDKKLPTTTIEGDFFRARRVEGSEVLLTQKMYNPPIGKSQEGRFNHAGQSHLYLANDKETAIREVISDEKSVLVWVQQFTIEGRIDDILDLSFDWSHLTPSTSALLLSLKVYNTIGRSDRNSENWRPDYYLTRYIMDCAKFHGYKGIKYNSSKDSFNFDLVLFYPDKVKIKAVGKPRIEIFFNKEEEDEFRRDFLEL